MKRAAQIIATLCALWAVSPQGASVLAAENPSAPPLFEPVLKNDAAADVMLPPAPPAFKGSLPLTTKKAAKESAPAPKPMSKPQTSHEEGIPAPAAKAKPPANRPVLECTGSTIHARRVNDDLSVFRAMFRPAHTAELIVAGCVKVQQGCNSCVVRYRNCEPEAAKCKDGACLANHCERKVHCTAKSCTAEGSKPPSCNARFAQHRCNLSLFKGKKGSHMEGVPVVQRRR